MSTATEIIGLPWCPTGTSCLIASGKKELDLNKLQNTSHEKSEFIHQIPWYIKRPQNMEMYIYFWYMI